MAEITLEHLGDPADPNIQRIPLRDIFGTSGIPVELAKQLEAKIKEKKFAQADKWMLLKDLSLGSSI